MSAKTYSSFVTKESPRSFGFSGGRPSGAASPKSSSTKDTPPPKSQKDEFWLDELASPSKEGEKDSKSEELSPATERTKKGGDKTDATPQSSKAEDKSAKKKEKDTDKPAESSDMETSEDTSEKAGEEQSESTKDEEGTTGKKRKAETDISTDAKRQKTGDGKAKKKKKGKKTLYGFIKKMYKARYPDASFAKNLISCLDLGLYDCIDGVTSDCRNMMIDSSSKTIDQNKMECALRIRLPKNLGKAAVEEARVASKRYTEEIRVKKEPKEEKESSDGETQKTEEKETKKKPTESKKKPGKTAEIKKE